MPAIELLIIVAASVPFLPALRGDFVFDDWESVVHNPVVNGKAPIQDVLWRDYWGRDMSNAASHKSYRPLTTLLFRLQWTFSSGRPQLFHLVGICLHCIVSLLVLELSKRLVKALDLQKGLANTAAVVFALHPVHTEAIANISCQAELLSALFHLVGINFYLTKCHDLKSTRAFVLVLLAVASVFSKEQGIALLPICGVLSKLLMRKNHTLLLVSFTILLSAVRLQMAGSPPRFSPLDNPAAFVEQPLFRWLSIGWQWLLHLQLLVAPFKLCFDYSMGCIPPIQSLMDPRIAVLLVSGVLTATSSFKFYRDSAKELQSLMIFAVLCGAISFFPASNILVVVGFPVAERVLYLPSIGFALLVAVLWQRMEKIYGKLDSHAVLLTFLAAILCFQRSGEWTTELRLYSSGLLVCPNNAKIHYNLAKILSDQGNELESEREYREAIRLNPNYEQALNNLGNLLEKRGRLNESEAFLRAAVARRPDFAAAWMNLGITTMNAGKYNQSEHAYWESLKLRPNSPDCYFNLGNLYQRMGELEMAVDAWHKATRLNAAHCTSWTNLLVALDEIGRCSTAVSLESSALHHCTPVAAVRSQLGVCFAQLKQYQKAEGHLTAAMRLAPTSTTYRSNYDVFLRLKMQNRNF